ncbi:hypothetical protein [Hymenobacter glacieicola]|uniref:Uncharacterized protein n=1 Tax=Hymenobacter glacieicola TaxID=1562124 RepID=A0ABQ1X3N2_9BACT|nr:hypothetical protein [Hymenobacter glacieicola]GGG54242.1 hypothetical protein GCM10011378_33060 [Hymenobacter glacieicola]
MFQFLRTRALLICISLLPLLATAQQRLPAARQRSYLTKVFRLTDTQTRQLYEKGMGAARPDFFAQPVDSFPTDQPGQARPLPLGYYLRARTNCSAWGQYHVAGRANSFS